LSGLGPRRTRLSTAGRWGLIGVCSLVVLAIAAPLIAPYPAAQQFDPVAGRYLPPLTSRKAVELHDGRWLLADSARSLAAGIELHRLDRLEVIPTDRLADPTSDAPVESLFFLLGTDKFGRDLWSRIAYGARISLAIGLLATAISLFLGILVGGTAAMAGGWVDAVLMRLVDALLMFPRLFLILTLAAFTGVRLWIVVLVLGVTGWMSVSRLVRAELLRVREADFVMAARAMGQHPLRILWRHMLPHAMAPVVVDLSLRIGAVILIEAALSFLGFGVQPPTPSWGNIIADGTDALASGWWATAFPGLAISVTVVAFNLLGDGLRDTLDPRHYETR
jgi:peptide/nickel transport system permease protein